MDEFLEAVARMLDRADGYRAAASEVVAASFFTTVDDGPKSLDPVAVLDLLSVATDAEKNLDTALEECREQLNNINSQLH